jgi:23S rRNA (guanosine2251-2'-O)-methyltransferase
VSGRGRGRRSSRKGSPGGREEPPGKRRGRPGGGEGRPDKRHDRPRAGEDRPDDRDDRPRAGEDRPDKRHGHGAPAPITDDTVLYGRNAVEEALKARRRRVHRIHATSSAAREPWLRDANVPIEIADADEIARRAGSDGHQGVTAEVDPYPYADPDDLLRRPDPLIVALDEVQDPQNLGAICRTAECAGADGLVICERRAAHVTPAVAKASAGAVEHLPIARVRNLTDFLLAARDAGAWSYGAAAADTAVPYTEPDYRGGVVLVLGSEGRGLRPRVAGACDALIELPLRGRIGSLNVSAAAAALLYGILHLRDSA